MALAGMSSKEISEVLGMKPNTVSNMLLRGRHKGVLPWRKEADMSPKYRLKKSGVTLGAMMSVVQGLSPEQRSWLIGQTEDLGCETIAEFIIEIVRDAYEEDLSKRSKDHG